jgi:hypothetical protein
MFDAKLRHISLAEQGRRLRPGMDPVTSGLSPSNVEIAVRSAGEVAEG